MNYEFRENLLSDIRFSLKDENKSTNVIPIFRDRFGKILKENPHVISDKVRGF